MNIIIIGSVAFDSIKTPFGSVSDTLGGSAVYSSLAASMFTKPAIVAVVGDDFSDANKRTLTTRGIDISGLEQSTGKTFRWGGEYSFDLNSRTTLFTELNVFEQFNPRVPDLLKNSEYVFLGNIHPLLQMKVLEQIENPKMVGLDTMNYWIESAKPELIAVIKRINTLIINESEAREFTGQHNITKAAKNILNLMDAQKQPVVIIKRGEYGVMMYAQDQFFFLPAYPLEDVVDPTGAGDTFAGGFIGYLASQNTTSWEAYKKACVAGSVLASFCVEHMGAEKFSQISVDDIQKRMEHFKELY